MVCECCFFSVVGMNNSGGGGGNMIMTNSNMSTMAGMAGGGLVVSSSVNKPLGNAATMLAPGQHHPGVPQVSLITFLTFKCCLTSLKCSDCSYSIIFFWCCFFSDKHLLQFIKLLLLLL